MSKIVFGILFFQCALYGSMGALAFSLDEANEARSALGLPEAEKLSDEELAPQLERWDAAVAANDWREISRSLSTIAVRADSDRFGDVLLLRYVNPELVDRVVERYLHDVAVLSRPLDKEPVRGMTDIQRNVAEIALSTFDERLADVAFVCGADIGQQAASIGRRMRSAYLAVVLPEQTLDFYLTASMGPPMGVRNDQPDQPCGHFKNVHCPDDGVLFITLPGGFNTLASIAALHPNLLEARREQVIDFVGDYALAFAYERDLGKYARPHGRGGYSFVEDTGVRVAALDILAAIGTAQDAPLARAIRNTPMPREAVSERSQERRERRFEEMRQVAEETLAKLEAR